MQERINEINQQILDLKQEKDNLIKQMFEVLPFKEKFTLWVEEAEKEHVRYFVYLDDTCPIIYNKLKEELGGGYIERYKTINFLEYFEDEIYGYIENEYDPNFEELEIFKELMNANLGTTLIDW